MSVKYKVVERANPTDREAPKKFYPSIQYTGRMTLRELSQRAALMSTLTSVDVLAALESFLTILPEELAKGNIVELGEFGSFWLRTAAEGVALEGDVGAEQINAVLPRFMPGPEFKKALKNVKFSKA